MSRLADYFVVIGYNFEKSRNGESEGKIIQRFPFKEWDDYPYEFEIENFCQPCGWCLTRSKAAPTFFIAHLTSTEANRYYCACITFHEAVPDSKVLSETDGGSGSRPSSVMGLAVHGLTNGILGGTNGGDLDDEAEARRQEFDPNLIRPADLFSPKCLVLLARHEHFDVLKNCLSIIYTVYIDSHQQCSLEHIIANIVGDVDVPPTGGPRLTFSIGAGDRQMIQPAACPTLPVTRTCVAMLFKHFGIQNVLLLFSAMLNDQKILLCSKSMNRLTDACHALSSLLYPLKYGNVFVPILPKNLLDFLNAPTPYLVGIHSGCRPHLPDLFDVFIADLDGGSVACPENTPFTLVSEPFLSNTVDSLTKILNPELLTADEVYPPERGPSPDPAWQDKQLRAIFIRLFAQLFSGYRSCLVITRINPQLVIHFNQSLFLLLRGLWDGDEFISRLLATMAFNKFIEARGPPFRVCDVFDEEYSATPDLLRRERNHPELYMEHIDRLARKLWDNENVGQPVIHHLPPGAVEAHRRIHESPFPLLDADVVLELINKRLAEKDRSKVFEQPEPRFVPHGAELDNKIFKAETLLDKNKVIREFVANIFSNHFTEALKRRNTIRQDLKARLIRRIFVDELFKQLYPTHEGPADSMNGPALGGQSASLLSYEQFDLIVDLLGEALKQEGQSEDSGIAPIIMELSNSFCTQLNNMRFYANMTEQLQRHPVWETLSFWESAFCDQVNHEIRQLYLYNAEVVPQHKTEEEEHASTSPAYTSKMSTLAIAAEELKLQAHRTEGVAKRLEQLEVNTVNSQILHFLNLIVKFRLPVDMCTNKNIPVLSAPDGMDGGGSSQLTYYGDSHSMDRDSAYEEQSSAVMISNLTAWLKKFVDKVGGENYLCNDNIEKIKKKIEGVIEGHMLDLESVYPEVKSIPKIKKPEVTDPNLFPNEVYIRLTGRKSLRCQLLLDGRYERVEWQKLREGDPCLEPVGVGLGVGGAMTPSITVSAVGGTNVDYLEDLETIKPMLPAHGALFLTNYRVIFRGVPRDQFQSNKVVCRSFPISSLLSFEKLHNQKIPSSFTGTTSKDECLEVFQLRSTTLQLIKVGVDLDDLTPSFREELKARFYELRYPTDLELSFNPPPNPASVPARRGGSLEGDEDLPRRTGTMSSSRSGGHLGEIDDELGSLPDEGYSAHKRKEGKTATLRRAAKETISSTMQRIGIRQTKHGRSSPGSARRHQHHYSQSDSERSSMVFEEEGKALDLPSHSYAGSDSPRVIQRLQSLPGYKEYVRLGLVHFPESPGGKPGKNDLMRLTLNLGFDVSKSYPAMLVVPKDFPEHHLATFSRSHRQCRFPAVVWRHPRTRALLLRGGGFRNKGVLSMIKYKGTSHSSGQGSSTTAAGLQLNEPETTLAKQQEHYFRCLVAISPKPDEATVSALLVSSDPSRTPLPKKKKIIDRAIKTLRQSGGKAKSETGMLQVPRLPPHLERTGGSFREPYTPRGHPTKLSSASMRIDAKSRPVVESRVKQREYCSGKYSPDLLLYFIRMLLAE